MSNEQGLFENMESTCGCGKPARYTSKDGKGSCNKYKRCPSYDELVSINKKLQEDLDEASNKLKNIKDCYRILQGL